MQYNKEKSITPMPDLPSDSSQGGTSDALTTQGITPPPPRDDE